MTKSKFEYLIRNIDDRKNTGYDYEGKIFLNSLSSYIYFNKSIQPFLLKLENFFHFSINEIGRIKKLYNYTLRNTDKIW